MKSGMESGADMRELVEGSDRLIDFVLDLLMHGLNFVNIYHTHSHPSSVGSTCSA